MTNPLDPRKQDHSSESDDGVTTPRSVSLTQNSGEGVKTETWIALCAQAAVEQDPKRLLDLVSKINLLLGARKKRLSREDGQKSAENQSADRTERKE